MKKHSILSTIFPRLGFNNLTLSELLGKHKDPSGTLHPYITREITSASGKTGLLVTDLFEPIEVDDLRCRVHLQYTELSPGEPHYDVMSTGTSNSAKVFVVCRVSTAEGIIAKPLDGVTESDIHYFFARLIERYPKVTIHFNILIVLAKNQILETSANERLLNHHRAERKELVALELTTGYRRYINIFLKFLLALAHHRKHKNPNWSIGLSAGYLTVSDAYVVDDTVGGNFHASIEDSWRLVCLFSQVKDAARIINLDENECKIPVISLNHFVNSILSDDSSGKKGGESIKIIKLLHKTEHVSLQIGLKKCLEYFIYEGIPSKMAMQQEPVP